MAICDVCTAASLLRRTGRDDVVVAVALRSSGQIYFVSVPTVFNPGVKLTMAGRKRPAMDHGRIYGPQWFGLDAVRRPRPHGVARQRVRSLTDRRAAGCERGGGVSAVRAAQAAGGGLPPLLQEARRRPASPGGGGRLPHR